MWPLYTSHFINDLSQQTAAACSCLFSSCQYISILRTGEACCGLARAQELQSGERLPICLCANTFYCRARRYGLPKNSHFDCPCRMFIWLCVCLFLILPEHRKCEHTHTHTPWQWSMVRYHLYYGAHAGVLHAVVSCCCPLAGLKLLP